METQKQKWMVRQSMLLSVAVAVMFFSQVVPSPAAGPPSRVATPDFTQGDRIPEDANHAWNLGATGARGWMFSDKLDEED
jgi:hypothetical protein